MSCSTDSESERCKERGPGDSDAVITRLLIWQIGLPLSMLVDAWAQRLMPGVLALSTAAMNKGCLRYFIDRSEMSAELPVRLSEHINQTET